MKRIKTILVATLMVLATFAIGAAQSMIINSEQKNSTKKVIQNTNYDAIITFYIYEGEGCACEPIVGAYINATSSEGPEYNITDEDGIGILQMVIFTDYKVTIEAQNYHTIIFDFNVVDDQTFKFHAGEAGSEGSSQNIPQAKQIIQELQQFLRIREGINNLVK